MTDPALQRPLVHPTEPAAPRPWARNPLRRSNLHPIRLLLLAGATCALAVAQPTATGLALGVPLIAAGAALRLWAAGYLVKTHRLSVDGPYGHLRHPLYAGTLLLGLGFGSAAGGWVARLGIPALLAHFFLYYLPRKERIESRRLDERHGALHRTYRAAVPALFPRLRPWRPGPAGAARPRSWSLDRVRDNDELAAAAALATALSLVVLRFWLGS